MNQKIANGQILQGDVLDKIKEIPDESIDLTIFSPPYWALRNYSVEGQWGLEPNFQDFLAKMDSLMDEIRRVTKKTGTVFVNFGDTYAGGLSHSGWESVDDRFKSQKMDKERFYAHPKVGVQKKSLYGIPERFYINCIDKGWIARNFIPWIKENAMPQSVPDRFTNKWERIFFFAKEGKYFFNLDAVREKPKYEPKNEKTLSPEKQSTLFSIENEDVDSTKKQDNTLRPEGIDRSKLGFNDRWEKTLYDRFAGDDPGNKARVKAAMNMMQGSNPNGKNPGDVFRINPTPLPEAHFATFPLNLPLKIIKCACPERVCSDCGYPDMLTPNISDSITKTNGGKSLQGMSEGDSIKGRSLSTKEVLLDKLLQSTHKEIKEKSEYELKRLSSDLDKKQIPFRTSSNNGEEVRKEITKNRGNSSYQWSKDGQPSGEFTSDDDRRTQPSSQTSSQTNPMSSLSKMDQNKWTCKKCGSHDNHPGVVFDCFMGAGTVALAAEILSRNWIGIELKRSYIEIIKKRLEPHNNQRIF